MHSRHEVSVAKVFCDLCDGVHRHARAGTQEPHAHRYLNDLIDVFALAKSAQLPLTEAKAASFFKRTLEAGNHQYGAMMMTEEMLEELIPLFDEKPNVDLTSPRAFVKATQASHAEMLLAEAITGIEISVTTVSGHPCVLTDSMGVVMSSTSTSVMHEFGSPRMTTIYL